VRLEAHHVEARDSQNRVYREGVEVLRGAGGWAATSADFWRVQQAIDQQGLQQAVERLPGAGYLPPA
jgi:hypothetical protein